MRGEKDGREYCLGKRERAEEVGRTGAEENAVRGGFQTILLVRSRDAGKTETASGHGSWGLGFREVWHTGQCSR